MTDSFDGYGSMVSPATYVDHNSPQHVVDLVVTAQPISGFKWIHHGHESTPGVYKPLEGSQTAVSELKFDTFREFTTFEFGYDDAEADGHMFMTDLTVMFDDGSGAVDVSTKFTHDGTANSFTWNDAVNKMPVGEYVFSFSHQFRPSADQGILAVYKLSDSITITAPNQVGVDESRTYQFPEVHTREYELSFYNLTVIK
jgi:hypothetical protein